MRHVLSLIADPQKAPLAESLARRVAEAAGAAGAETGPARWLSPGEAWEIPLDGDAGRALAAVRTEAADAAVDVNIVPDGNRRKKLLVADMDSTMIGQECIDELAEAAGVGDQVRQVTARAMNGELDFEDALLARVGLLARQPAAIVADVIARRISFTPGGRTLIATMRASGAHTALVSGGFTRFTAHVADALGFDEHHANTLLEEDGRLTGDVARPILGRQAKVEALDRLTASLERGRADAIAVGDGANDIPMLQAAGLGVALHAKPIVRQAVPVAVSHGDLTALLYLQGYSRDQFSAG